MWHRGKGYLFVGSDAGRAARCRLISLIESAESNGIDLQAWLAELPLWKWNDRTAKLTA